ncbi:hypothetical protein RND71_026214 [Anisodus tanguticus]|uniref:Uncharacterized protein n=1 Tax=Anisodus tanguticus TaxID=243964 RepID=A0AAE1RKI7_9SOLA|nr:hypothetical protein RND71_026214 [Anisodus tanguticus]
MTQLREREEEHLCAWGNDAASEVLTEARLLLVENYFQTPLRPWFCLGRREFLEGLPFWREREEEHLCAWGNDAASEVLTEARLLFVENYFQTPLRPWFCLGRREFLEGLPFWREREEEHLCAWGNDAASEVLTEARLLLVENYFQTPLRPWFCLGRREFLEGLPFWREREEEHLCAWGNDAASEVLTEARLLLVENYFQTPLRPWFCLGRREFLEGLPFWKGIGKSAYKNVRGKEKKNIFALGAMTQLVRFYPRRVYCWLKTISKPPLRPWFCLGRREFLEGLPFWMVDAKVIVAEIADAEVNVAEIDLMEIYKGVEYYEEYMEIDLGTILGPTVIYSLRRSCMCEETRSPTCETLVFNSSKMGIKSHIFYHHPPLSITPISAIIRSYSFLAMHRAMSRTMHFWLSLS